MSLITFLTFFSGFSFLFFGTASLFTSQMKSEFMRYGLENFRALIGVLQLLGALGLLLGYFYSPLLQTLAASGLSILMILGFFVRMRIRDSFIKSAPSLIYAVLNATLFIMLLDIL